MDEQVQRKQSILNELKRRMEGNQLKQEDITDLKQELERCNHIQQHILRGQANPSGRWITAAVFGTFGLVIHSAWRGRLSEGRKFQKIISLFPMIFFPALYGYNYGAKRFGNKKEFVRYSIMDKSSKEVDDQFYAIANNLTLADLKH